MDDRSDRLPLLRPEIQEVCRALEKMCFGRRAQLDAARLLELSERLKDLGERYWSSLALEAANQAARP